MRPNLEKIWLGKEIYARRYNRKTERFMDDKPTLAMVYGIPEEGEGDEYFVVKKLRGGYGRKYNQRASNSRKAKMVTRQSSLGTYITLRFDEHGITWFEKDDMDWREFMWN